MKILFTLILLFLAMTAVSFIIIKFHKLFFKQELDDIIEEANEEGTKRKVQKKANKLRQ